MIKIQIAKTDADIKKSLAVMMLIRPAFISKPKDFINTVKRQQKSGYILAFLKEDEEVKTVAGFRIIEYLFWGKSLYVDDFVTDGKSRKKGYGKKLFDWLISYAKKEGCKELHLDSGTWKERFDAHRFYHNNGLNIVALHFSRKI